MSLAAQEICARFLKKKKSHLGSAGEMPEILYYTHGREEDVYYTQG